MDITKCVELIIETKSVDMQTFYFGLANWFFNLHSMSIIKTPDISNTTDGKGQEFREQTFRFSTQTSFNENFGFFIWLDHDILTVLVLPLSGVFASFYSSIFSRLG